MYTLRSPSMCSMICCLSSYRTTPDWTRLSNLERTRDSSILGELFLYADWTIYGLSNWKEHAVQSDLGDWLGQLAVAFVYIAKLSGKYGSFKYLSVFIRD